MIARGLVLFFTTVLLVGCAAKGHEPSVIPSFDKTVDITRVWRTSIGSASQIFSEISSLGSITCATADHKILCVDSSDASPIFEKDFDHLVLSGVTVSRSGLFLTASTGEIMSLEMNGSVRWVNNVREEILGRPIAARDVLLVRTITGAMYSYSQEDGGLRWKSSPERRRLVLRAAASPVESSDGNILVGFPGGALSKLDFTTGEVIWNGMVAIPTGDNEIERLTDVVGTPLVLDDRVCAAAYQGRVGCFNQSTGAILWSKPVSAIGSLATNGSDLYITTSDGELLCIDGRTGVEIWRQTSLRYRGLTSPSFVSGMLLVGDYDGNILALDAADGRLVGVSSGGGGRMTSSPVVAGDKVVTLTSSGSLSVFSLVGKDI